MMNRFFTLLFAASCLTAVGQIQGDVNGDSCVQLEDLLALLGAFGNCGLEDSVGQCGLPVEYQGYDYQTVLIGNQCWFAENLRSQNYQNGDPIEGGLNQEEWGSTQTGARSFFGESGDSCISVTAHGFPAFPATPCEDPEIALASYGRLYNWFAVEDERGICPVGWHVPVMTEFAELELFVEELYPEHSALVLRNPDTWGSPVTGLDLFGFNLQPAGYRGYLPFFDGAQYQGAGRRGTWFWTTDLGSDEGKAMAFGAWAFNEVNSEVFQSLIGSGQNQHRFGFSVRCIKDTE